MDTLQERMFDAIYDAEYEEIRHSAIYQIDINKASGSCTKIAIDFAKGFAEWCVNNTCFEFNTTDCDELITLYIESLNNLNE